MDLGIGGLGDGHEIGHGASAVVYRATQVDLDRDVAVKLLTASDADFVARFKREAKTLGKLSQHAGIVTVYDSGINHNGRPYLIMELCQESLLDRLRAEGPVDPIEACRIMADVTAAVAEAHGDGVVHRDIKPANVLIGSGGRILISDFGIAATTGNTTGNSETVTFTAGYAAPETVRGESTEAPADIYGIGATLFHLVSGEPPFIGSDENPNLLAVVQRIGNEPVRDLRADGIPDAVCDVIERTMAKDPADRPDAGELHRTLLHIVDGHGTLDIDLIGSAAAPAAAPAVATAVPGQGTDGQDANGRDTDRQNPDEKDAGDAAVDDQVGDESTGDDDGTGADGPPPADRAENGAEDADTGAESAASGGPVSDTPASDDPASAGPVSDSRAAAPDAEAPVEADAAVDPAWAPAPSTQAQQPDDVAATATTMVTPDSIALPKPSPPSAPADGPIRLGRAPDDLPPPPDLESAGGGLPPIRRRWWQWDERPVSGRVLATVAAVVVTVALLGVVALVAGGDDDDGSTNIAAGDGTADTTPAVEPAAPSAGNQSDAAEPGSFGPTGPPELQSDLASASRRIEVPAVAGEREAAATELLVEAGFRVNVVYRTDGSVGVGRVIDQDPAAEVDAPEDSLVTIFVSRRVQDPPIPVPPVADDSVAEAVAALEAAGFTVADQQSILNDEVPAGAVVGTDPPAGTPVNAGGDIVLFISLGRPVVPDLVGRTQAEAEAALAELTLTATVVTGPGFQPIGTIERTTPAAGTAVPIDSAVEVFVVDSPPPDCTMDLATLVGLDQAAAQARIRAAGCSVGAALPTEHHPTIGVDLVVRGVFAGPAVQLVLSKGPEPTPCVAAELAAVVADLAGKTRAAAVAEIRAISCTAGADLPPEPSATIDEGLVIRGEISGDTVRLVLAAPPVPTDCTVPAVIGLTVAAATTAIRDAGCTGPIDAGGAAQTDEVTAVAPVATTVIRVGAAITLTAAAPDPTVPNVVGQATATATKALTDLGFKVAVVEKSLPAGDPGIGLVTDQTPVGGTTAPAGTEVTITVGVEEAAGAGAGQIDGGAPGP
ncbi:MAG: PASTA domain-containing protein [Actinomycetota bacterium]